MLIVGYAYGYFTVGDPVKVGWLTVAEFIVLAPIVPFCWPLLGVQ
jgi:hypothetical protein